MVAVVEIHKSKNGDVEFKGLKGYKYEEAARFSLEQSARAYSEMHPYGVVINNGNDVSVTDDSGMHEWLIEPLIITEMDPEA